MDRLLPAITSILVDLLQPAGILARNDPKVRTLEGLPQTVDVLHGEIPDSVVVREGPVEYDVDLRKGQKTGLVSRPARESRGGGALRARAAARLFQLHTAGFALRLARTCPEAEALDISADAVARIRANADPQRRAAPAGARGERVRRAAPARARRARATTPSCSTRRRSRRTRRRCRTRWPATRRSTCARCGCSLPVDISSPAAVRTTSTKRCSPTVIHEASIDSHTPMTIVEKRMQGRDHPVLVGVPETYYLKCFILRRVE